ncbi:uncharacterized protein DS421_20g698940 [Arachis hypogaea]|nr:uncharacterized protein DS421_20g698940 [Arachis hypogaea]
MAYTDGRDPDINRLNATWHYAGTAVFVSSRLVLPRRMSHMLLPPDVILPYLREAGFGDTVPLKDYIFDNSLIMEFVERWRPKTHTSQWGVLPWFLQMVRHGDIGVGGATARCQASDGCVAGGAEEGVTLAKAYMAVGPCLPYALDG